MIDDYGDGAVSSAFYKGAIPEDQKKMAKRACTLVEQKIGRFSRLRTLVDSRSPADADVARRAKRMVTRALSLQWIQGNADMAETSFYKINSQGTPLDDTEEMLIRNRRKAIAISARAILRSGTGHKYWSAFDDDHREKIEALAEEFYDVLFEPETAEPIKTLDVPFGGSVSPVDALALLVEFLSIAGHRNADIKPIEKYVDDENGAETIQMLTKTLEVLSRITGNSPASLGLHPAVYFYNEKGKYSRFLFLGMVMLITQKLRNNEGSFFKRFCEARSEVERFLIENKSLIGILLQNMSRTQRISKMGDMFSYLVTHGVSGSRITPEAVIANLGLRGRIFDINTIQVSSKISDDTKSMLFIQTAMANALKCNICGGLLQPSKSVSYDHVKRVRDGGTGDLSNTQMVHHFCNTGIKN